MFEGYFNRLGPHDRPTHGFTALNGTDAGGRTGEYQVAGREFYVSGEGRDDFGNAPDHVLEIAGLTHISADGQRDRSARGRKSSGQGADWRGMIKPLGHVPRPGGFFCLRLQIPPRQINPYRVAENHRWRVGGMNVRAAFVQRYHQLDFVVQV